MSAALVSVVIPAYNRAATIVAALLSIQAQTYQNWEAIVVDDGSVDGTPEVVMQLAHQDARIRLMRHKRNRGAQAARNTGIRAGQGEWIAFLDSDDQWLPDSLEVRLEVARKEKVSVVHSEGYEVREDGILRLRGVAPIAGQVYKSLLTHEGPLFQGLLVSREALEKINYLDERIVAYQEWDTFIRLAKYYPFGFEAQPTFITDRRGADMISKDKRRGARGYEQVVQKHYRAILREAGAGVLAQHYRNAAGWYEAGGDRYAVRRCMAMASVWSFYDRSKTLQRMQQMLQKIRQKLRKLR